MNYKDLIYFKDVYELNSFTKAAEKNYIAQTAVSHSVKRFEKEIGEELLVRKRGALELTEAGELVYKDVKKIIRMYEETCVKIAKLKCNNHVRIGYIDAYELVRFSDLNNTLEEKFPQITFEWVDRYSVLEQQCDIEIGYDFEFDDLISDNIYKYANKTSVFWVSKKNDLSKKESITWRDLEGQNLIILTRNRKMGVDELKGKNIQLVVSFFKERNINVRFVYSAMERRCLVECNKGVALVEKDLYKYDESMCKQIAVEKESHIPQFINYVVCKNAEFNRIAKIIMSYLEK